MRIAGTLGTAEGTPHHQRRPLRNGPPSTPHNGEGGDQLTVTLSVTLALAGVVVLLSRYAGLRFWHAVVCILLGFYLASSSLAPEISSLTRSLFRSL
jgi:hypothetical protein